MKVNKKHIGWIIGLVCVVVLALLLSMCGKEPNDVIDPTDQTGESTGQTETAETTEATEETEETEATEESTEETTEETTEPTEATTIPTAPSTNNAIGSPGNFGTPEEDPTEETTEPTEPEEVVIVPAGQDSNPYTEVIWEYPAGFDSVNVPGNSMITYAVFVNDGAELTIESPDAYVIHNAKTYDSTDGVVKLLLSAGKNVPAIIQLGNKAPGEKMFQLSFIDALGEPTNPLILEKLDEVQVALKEDDQTGYTMQWTAAEEGSVAFSVAKITDNVACDVILTVGEKSVHLVQPKEETEGDAAAQSEKENTEVSIGVNKGDVVTIQVITLMPEKEAQQPAEGESAPSEPEIEVLPSAEITLKGSFIAGENPDKEDQTEPTDPIVPDESTEPTEPTLPGESTDPSDPSDVTDPSDPSDPTDPSGPSDATDPSDPSDPTDPSDPSDPTDPGNPGEPTEPTEPEPTEPVPANYTVKVTDYNGNPKSNVAVKILENGMIKELLTVDAQGVAKSQFTSGSYSVELLFSGEELYYEEKKAVLSEDAPELTIQVATALEGTFEPMSEGNGYYVGVGGTYARIQADVINYFLFEPQVPGNYLFTTSDPEAQISYWGGNIYFVFDGTDSTDFANNAFTRNVKEENIGATYVIGVTGATDCILEIIRLGDPILDENDFPITVYEGTKAVETIAPLPAGKTLKYMDLTASTDSIKLVLNPQEGYYHLNSADGPLVYVNLGPNAPYISMYALLGLTGVGGTNLTQRFYEDGQLVKREDYTDLMIAYTEAADDTYGLYPLTEDLVYMIQQGGDFMGWWDAENPNYVFAETPGLSTEIAWMFACCTIN